MGKNIIVTIVVLISAVISVLSLVHSGLPPTHDGEYHVVRFYEFDTVLRSGVFYPRWAPDLNMGYGVPLFNFVYPFPNYMASLFHVLGFSFIDAFKLNMIAATLLGAVFMYLWSREFWGNLGGLVSSILYSFSPYRLVDIYVRGSVGEVWALAFLPLILWGITKVIKEKDSRFAPLVSIGTALLIFSHNILALLFFGFILCYIFFLSYTLRYFEKLKILLLSVLLGLGLSAIFWLPALLEKEFVRGLEVFAVDRHFVEVYQLLIPSWGTGFSGDAFQGMSFQIGVINFLVMMVALFILVIWREKKLERAFITFSLLSLLLLILFMLPLSQTLWKIIPLITYFQFPWRLLSLVIVLCAFLGGIFGVVRFRAILSGALILGAIFLTYSYTIPAYYHNRDDNHYLSRSNFIHGTNSPGDVFNTMWFVQKKNPISHKLVFADGGKMNNVFIQPTRYTADVTLTESSQITINTAYFPGWKLMYHGKKHELSPTKDGIMSASLPKGEYRLTVLFIDTIVRQVSTYISLISFISVFFLGYKIIKHENSHR